MQGKVYGRSLRMFGNVVETFLYQTERRNFGLPGQRAKRGRQVQPDAARVNAAKPVGHLTESRRETQLLEDRRAQRRNNPPDLCNRAFGHFASLVERPPQ